MGVFDIFLHASFVHALPDEYGHAKVTLQAMKNHDRVEIICMVGTRYSTLPHKKGLQRSSRPPEQAFFSSKSGGRNGAQRGCGRGRRGIQGRGRGGRRSKGGGNSIKGGGSNCRGGSSSASSASGSSHGGGSRLRGRFWRCNRRDHIREECTTKESNLLAKCASCSGFGHEESTCSSDAVVLASELPMSEEDFAVETQAFVAKETGKCRVMVGEQVGGGELGKQVVQYIADSAATCNMTPDVDALTSYRVCSRPLGLANGGTISIAGYGDLTVAFRSDNGWVHVKLHDVVHTPLLSYNFISLPYLALEGHMYAGDKDGVTFKLRWGKTVHFPLIGNICRQNEHRLEAKGRVVDNACAVIAPGQAKAPITPPDTNTSHCTYGHTHEVLLKKMVESKESTSAGNSTSTRGIQWRRGYGSPLTGRRTPEQVPFTPPAPPQQLPPIAEEGESTAGESASEEGTIEERASSQGGGRMEDLDSESNLDNMTKLWPPVPPVTHEAPAAEPGAGAAGVRKATPRPHRSPPGGSISVASTAAVAAAAVTTAVPAVKAVTATTTGTFSRS